MTSMLMSSPSISILHQLFQCRYSNSGNVVASSPCVSHLAARESQRACWQARTDQAFRYWVILVLKANIDVLTLVTSLVSVVFFFFLIAIALFKKNQYQTSSMQETQTKTNLVLSTTSDLQTSNMIFTLGAKA